MKDNTKMTASEFIKEFLDFVESAKASYQFNFDAMKNEENITQDYLHKLELEGLNYHERGKIATCLAANRRARRDYKDAVEELQPVVDFFSDPHHKKLINQMHQLLGQVRKIESYHQRRFTFQGSSAARAQKTAMHQRTFQKLHKLPSTSSQKHIYTQKGCLTIK